MSSGAPRSVGGRAASQLRIHSLFAVLLLLPCLLSMPAAAQALNRASQDLLSTFDTQMATMDPNAVRLRLGVGSIFTARLDASASKIHPVVPYVNFNYKQWFTLDENEARFNFFTNRSAIGAAGWRMGPMIKVDLGRGRFNKMDLRTFGKVDLTLEVGGFVSYTYGPARLRVRVRGDATGAHGGVVTEVDARLGFYKSQHLTMGVQFETAFASSPYMRTFYGVTPAQAAASGLAAFNPGGGARSFSAALLGEYKFNPRWAVLAALQYTHLIGPAAASPLTQRLGATNRANLGTFLVYTF